MVSLIMRSSRIHYLRLMEINRDELYHSDWLFAIMAPLVVIYVWYRVSRKDKKVRCDDVRRA